MLPSITATGRCVADPDLAFTQNGKARANVRVAFSDSKKDDAGWWQTTEQIFISLTFWEAEAEAVAELLRKGDEVTVTGRIYEREYETREGEKRRALEVKYPTIAKVVKAAKAQRPAPQQSYQAPANDPWAAPATPEEPPF